GAGNVVEQELLGPGGADDHGQDAEGEGADGHAAGGESVETVGEVDGVAGAGHDEGGEEDVGPTGKFDPEALGEGEKKRVGFGILDAVVVGEVGEDDAEADLEEEFFEAGESGAGAGAVGGGELEPVGGCADGAEAD